MNKDSTEYLYGNSYIIRTAVNHARVKRGNTMQPTGSVNQHNDAKNLAGNVTVSLTCVSWRLQKCDLAHFLTRRQR